MKDEYLDIPIYERKNLKPGNEIPGPTVVEQFDSTILVYPGQRLSVDEYGNIRIRL